jgi:hypothetical protein
MPGSRWERQGFPWLPSPAQPGRHDEPRAARHADRAGESEAEDAALEIAAEFLLDVARHGPLCLVAPLEPTLKMLRHDLVERSLLGAPTLVAACRRGAGMRPEARPRGKPAEGSDHGQSGGRKGEVFVRTLLGGCRPRQKAPFSRAIQVAGASGVPARETGIVRVLAAGGLFRCPSMESVLRHSRTAGIARRACRRTRLAGRPGQRRSGSHLPHAVGVNVLKAIPNSRE